GEAPLRHHLEGCVHITPITSAPYGDASAHLRREFARLAAPLFPCVRPIKRLIQFTPDAAQDKLLRVARGIHAFAQALQQGRRLLLIERTPEEHFKRREVDRKREQSATRKTPH